MTPIESLNYKEQGKSPGLVSFYSLPFPIFISGYWSFRPPYSSEGCSGFAPASLLSIRYTLFYVRYSISYSLPASTLFVNYFLSLWKQYRQNQKDLEGLDEPVRQGQFLCLDNYSVGWAFCPLTGYFTLPRYNLCHKAISFILFRGKVFILYKFFVLQRFPCSFMFQT